MNLLSGLANRSGAAINGIEDQLVGQQWAVVQRLQAVFKNGATIAEETL